MKAIRFTGPGGPEVMKLTECAIPEPEDDEVLIRIRAAGVNRPDILQRKGLYDPPPGVTDIPGLEVAGEIVRTGKNTQKCKPGDRVCAILPGGGYAEYVSVHADHIAPVPKGFSYAEAAGIMETFLTVWSHLYRFAGFRTGKSILIHGGASGIGTTATMLTKQSGALHIFTTVSNKHDQTASCRLGADISINYKTHIFEEEVKKHTGNRGVDFILDIIGGSYVARNYEAAAQYGTIVQVGLMHGKVKNLNLFPMLAKRLTHLGMTLRSQTPEEKALLVRELEKEVWPLFESGKIKPQIYKTFPLEEAAKAHVQMENGGHFGKLILVNSGK